MNIYRISQTKNSNYDTYDSAVVVARTEKEARSTHPGTFVAPGTWPSDGGSWVRKPEQVQVEYIGRAKRGMKAGVVVASFNAG